MKKIVCLFLPVLIPLVALTQVNNRAVSPTEAFAERTGTVLQKRFDKIGKVGTLTIQAEYITDLTTGDKMPCIRFDVSGADNLSGHYAMLDTNEVNELISFLKYITTNITPRPPIGTIAG